MWRLVLIAQMLSYGSGWVRGVRPGVDFEEVLTRSNARTGAAPRARGGIEFLTKRAVYPTPEIKHATAVLRER